MKKDFHGYYSLSEEQFSELWEKCIFVFDTNVLLNLYRYPEEARNDFINILKEIPDRVWIPYQVALEYQENRLSVIAEQIKLFEDVKKILKESQTTLTGSISKLHLEKRHSSIKPKEMLDKLSKLYTKFIGQLELLEGVQPDVFEDDVIRNQIDALFEEKVGKPPQSKDELAKIYEQGQIRYKERRPPGYMDVVKGNETADGVTTYHKGDLAFKKEYGDLLIWFQIIEECKQKQIKYVVFVTDDDKEDWWWCADSRGNKKIGPRPELMEEISMKAGTSLFYMYNSEHFLELAKKYFGAKIDKKTLDQIRDIIRTNRANRRRRLTPEQMQEVEEMIEWFYENYEDPANGVPYESAEGGYQYVFGGPYDAREELEAQFPDAETNEIDEALEKIEAEGTEWVKTGQY